MRVFTFRLGAVSAVFEVMAVTGLGALSGEEAVALTFVEDVVFPPTQAEMRGVGIEFGAETGPTGGPYRDTAFYIGVNATESRGTLPERDNVWCLAYNFDHCGGATLVPDEHSFHWTWEASYKPNESHPPLIENNVDVRYVDGAYHRPWAFHINTGLKRASLQFLPIPGVVKFQINMNGNVVIGTPFRQPAKQLEVVGDAYVTKNLQVAAI